MEPTNVGGTLLALGGTVNRRWVEDKSAFGRRMLEKMGWKEGKGLGKHEDGAATFVKVDRRIAAEGVGQAPESLVGDSQFKKNLTNFNDVLKALSKKATVMSQAAQVKQRKHDKKKQKKQRRKGQANALTVDKRRVRSKNARAYSQHDLHQVLGIESDPWAKGFHRVEADPAVLRARKDAAGGSDTETESDSDSDSDSDGGKSDTAAPPPPPPPTPAKPAEAPKAKKSKKRKSEGGGAPAAAAAVAAATAKKARGSKKDQKKDKKKDKKKKKKKSKKSKQSAASD